MRSRMQCTNEEHFQKLIELELILSNPIVVSESRLGYNYFCLIANSYAKNFKIILLKAIETAVNLQL